MTTEKNKLVAHYQKIAPDRRFNAWIHLVPMEENLRRLESLDPTLPLYGKTFAVKDNIDVAGLPTTAGCPAYAYIPAQSNPAVQAFMDAGALCLGKTNMDQFATGLVGTRSPHGPGRNAFVEDYISGGSSSGSAIAVARGHVDFSLGTDTAGSGRVPAAFNQLVGIKPTRGLLSTRGVVPACKSLDCLSIFTRTTGEARSLLALAAHFDPQDPWSRPQMRAGRPGKPWRIGIPQENQLFFDGDESARKAYFSALDQWKSLGHILVTIDLEPFLEVARLLYGGPWVSERYTAVGEFIQHINNQASEARHSLDPTVTQIILAGIKPNAADCFKALHRLQELRRATEPAWKAMDFLLLPTVPTCYPITEVQANPVELNSRLGTYTNFVNLLDLAALSIPHDTLASGVPTGVTLIGPAFCDDFLSDAAAQFFGETLPLAALHPLSTVRLAVVGAHLKGLPLHGQLVELDARYVRTTRTAPGYRLYVLPESKPLKPGMIRVNNGGGSIEVETYDLTPEAFGRFVSTIPSPLGIGTITLEDGECVKGFLCEPAALENAQEITQLGAWRAYLKGCSPS